MKRFLLFLLGVLLSGCSLMSRSVEVDGIAAYDGISDRYPNLAQHMAGQTAAEFSRRYPPGRTSVALVTAPGTFGESLDAGLRSLGFVVLPAGQGGLRVGYVLDEISGDISAYVRIRTSDGTSFGLVRKLADDTLAIPGQVLPVPAPAPWTPEPTVAVTPLTAGNSISPVAAPASDTMLATPRGAQGIVLPKGVLSVLPYDWRYTIPDESRRSAHVNSPKNIPWRDAIRTMADESGCTASFDETARRVTLKANPNAPRVAVTPTTPVAPVVQAASVSALHPASLPEQAPAVQHALENAAEQQVAPVSALVSHQEATPAAVVPEEKSADSATAPAVTEPAVAEVSETWALEPGSLHTQLSRWADQAGYQLVWKANEDLDMESATIFRGTFLKAVQQLFQGLARTGHSLRVTLYQTNNVMEIRGE